MRFLFDTNVLIPLEPTRAEDIEPNTEHAADLLRMISENGHSITWHPASRTDLYRDSDKVRRDARLALLRKYPLLPEPPDIPSTLVETIGVSSPQSNAHCDDLLLAALYCDSVDFLITEDKGLKRKSERVNLGDRVLSVHAASQVVSDLSEKQIHPPPRVESIKAHSLDDSDPIFEGLRLDYGSEFDDWLRKCKRQQRQTWVIRVPDSKILAAFCIVNQETDLPDGLTGRVLKLCTFKVSQESLGFRYGELLLKTVFDWASKNRYDWMYVTVFPHHVELIQLLADFGFSELSKMTNNETVLAKPMSIVAEDLIDMDPLDFHIRYGPQRFKLDENGLFLVPIQPRYGNRLFPETMVQYEWIHDNSPCGSALRKAYLCHSPTRLIKRGNVLLFYRSQSDQGVIAVGVVESAFVSKCPEEIVRKVAKRTVYSFEEIKGMCSKDVLVILFRQARIIWPIILSTELLEGRIMTRVPQSIMKVTKEGASWLQARISP